MLAATAVHVAGGKAMKPSDFYPPKKKRGGIELSPRQEKQLKAKQARDKARKAKANGG